MLMKYMGHKRVQIHLLKMNNVIVVNPLHANYDSDEDKDSYFLFVSSSSSSSHALILK